jgi:hypothetical protein
VHLGGWRRWSEWRVAEELLKIIELANGILASGADVGCVDLRHRCTHRNVIGGATIFHRKGRGIENLAVEDVVGKINHTFHFLEERKTEDDVDCNILSGCNTEGALFAVRRLVRKKELECSIEIRRNWMRLVGDDASKSDLGILLWTIDFVDAVGILFGQGEEVVDITSRQCSTGVNCHTHKRTVGIVKTSTKLKHNMWEVTDDLYGHRL